MKKTVQGPESKVREKTEVEIEKGRSQETE